MVYIVDDDWDTDLKVTRAGWEAFGLYIRCGMWVARRTYDGIVPQDIADAYVPPEIVQKLLHVGLWEVVEGGYFMPDYHRWNPTPEVVQKRREQKAARQRKWLENRGKKTRRGSNPSRGGSKDASRDASHDASEDVVRDAPLHLPSKEGVKGGGRPAPEDWGEDPALAEAMRTEMAEQAEHIVAAIAERQQQSTRGAALVRQALAEKKSTPSASVVRSGATRKESTHV